MYKLCHTEESSQRQRALERGLLEALVNQPYDKISLTELCRQLPVPRKTFYRYFSTKEDCLLALIDHTLSDCNDIALGGWDGRTVLTEQIQLRFFRYWKDQAPLLEAIAANALQHLLLDRTTVIVDRMKQTRPSDSFARDQLEYFIAHGLLATVLRWHHYGFQSSPEEMAAAFQDVLRLPWVRHFLYNRGRYFETGVKTMQIKLNPAAAKQLRTVKLLINL